MTTRLAILLAAVSLAACGGDDDFDPIGNQGDVVGGPCIDFMDCAPESFCASGGDFPGGMCTMDCRDDRDCPEETACIDKDGGLCMLLCHFDNECRRDYKCDDKDRRGASGKATVCVDD